MLSVSGLSFNIMEKCVFDPSTFPLTMLNNNYPGVPPWNGITSTGTSGSNSFATNGTNPALGTPVNGMHTALFAAKTNLLASGTLANYIQAASFSGWIVFNSSNNASNLDLLIDSGGVFNPYVSSSSNIRFIVNTSDLVAIPIKTNTWYWFSFRYDGVNISIGVNDLPGTPITGLTTSAAVSNVSSLTGTLTLGNPSAAGGGSSFQGNIAEVALTDQVLTDDDFLNAKNYVGWRYGLPL